MPRYALGIDGGGSKCDAVLMEESGAVIAWGRGGPTHVYYDPPEVISASYVEAVAGALREVQDADIWVAGHFPEGAPRDAVRAHNNLACHLEASEVDTAFASAQEEWGIIVLAGTGSFVHGRAPDGSDLHLGGRGPILNDYGSAYAIGLLGLRAAFASHWTEARRTSLAEAMPRALDVAGLDGVFDRVYIKGISRREIAALAKTVDAEASAGDRISIDCLHRAADELAELAIDVINELGLADLSFPAIRIGGVARHCRPWWDRVCHHLLAVAPDVRPVIPAVAPAVGAALLAMRHMGVPWTRDVIGRARETASRHAPDSF
jgi:N-acetylglucosamine kinase-like BadF-type ATPase